MAFFSKICNLNTFKPQLDEPEQPPINIKNNKIIVVKLPPGTEVISTKPLGCNEIMLKEIILSA